MKDFWKICAATLLLVATHIIVPWTASAAQPDQISVAYCQDCVPFQFNDENNQPAGLIIDQWRLWSEKTGIGIDFRAASWSETLRMVGAGEADVHAGLFYNIERDTYLDYGAALSKTDTHYFVHRDLPPLKSIEDLGSYRVGVLKGDYVEGFLQQKLPNGSIVGFQSYEDIMDALKAGQLSAFAADTLTGLHHVQRSNLGDAFEFPSDKPLYQNEWLVAVQNGNAQLLKIINDGMGRITPDERNAIAQRWTSSTVEQDENVVVISIPRTYPPFVISGFKGELRGLFVELWQQWSEATGIPIRFLPSGWLGTLDAVKSGAADIHSGLFKSDERSAWLDFSDPIHEIKTAVYFLTDSNNAAKLSEFHKKRVGAIAGTHQEQFLKGQYGDIEMKGYKGTSELISALLNGDVDFIVHEVPTVDNTLQRMGLQRDVSRGFDELLSNVIHAGVAKGNEDLLKKINEGFAAIEFDKLAELDAVWMVNPDHRFYRKVTEAVELTREEEDWLAVHPFIRFAVTSFINPVDIVDAEGNYSGMNADLMNLLNKKLGTRIVPEIFDKWGDVAENTLSGNVDGAFSFSRTPEREKHVYYTKPYAYDPVIVIARQGDDTVRSWSDLAGKHVSVAKGFSVVDELRRQVGDGKLNLVESDEDGLRLLSEGVTDAHVTFQLPYTNARKNVQIPGLRIVDAKNDEAGAFRMAVHKSQPVLFSIVQKGVNALTRGELSELQNRWLTPGQEKQDTIQPLDLSNAEQAWLDTHQRVRVMVGTWPPFHFMDGEKPRGLALDYVRHILKKVGLEIEYVPIKWTDALKDISNLETVDLLPTIARSAERENLVNFTQDYLSYPRVIFARKGDASITSLMDLNGKTVSVEENFITHKLLIKDHPEINLMPVATTKGALEAVSFGKADAFVSNLAVGSHLIDELGLANLTVAARTSYKNDIQAMGVRKDWSELASIIDKALAAMTANEKRVIRDRWLAIEDVEQQQPAIELNDEERAYIKAHPELRLGIDAAWPPFEFLNADGNYSGISSGVTSRVAEISGMKMEPVTGLNWKQVIDSAKSGEIDAIAMIQPTPERSAYLDFTKVYVSYPYVILTRDNAPFMIGLNGLKGMSAGVINGSAIEEYINNAYPEINLKPGPDVDSVLSALANGVTDAAVVNLAVATYVIDKLNLTSLKIAAPTEYSNELAMAVPKGETVLLGILQKSLDAIGEDEMTLIKNRWVAVTVELGLDLRTILIYALPIGGGLLLVIGVIVIWNRKLGREVEERIAAEKRLAERGEEVQRQRDLIKAVMDSMTVGVAAFDNNLKLIAWNQKFIDIRGYPDEMVHADTSFEELTRYDVDHYEFGDGDSEQIFAEKIELARKFETHAFERRRPNGAYIEVLGGPISGGGFVSTYADITERKQTERALNMAVEENKRQTERFRNLTNNLPAMVFQFMALGPEQIYITYASPFLRDTFEFGATDDDEITELFYDRLHPDDDERVRKAFAEIIENKGFLNETFRIEKTDGKVRWLEAAARCYEVTDGFMQWDGLILDITERKQAEEELQAAEEHTRLILDSAGEGVFGLDNQGVTTFVNPSACRMLGFSSEDMIGHAMHGMIHHTYADGTPYPMEKCHMRAAFMEGEVHTVTDEVLWRQDGTSFPVEYTSTPIEKDGELLGAVVTFSDVTERKKAEDEIMDARDKAEAATRSKAAFLAAMSHEIRTPMNGVVGMISLLQETQLESDQRTMMNTVQDSAFSLLQIINDILDSSKIEAGKMTLESIPVNIDTVMEGVTETLLPNVSKKNLRMSLFIDPDIPGHVMTDQVRLRQILFNLAGNATKFTENSAERQGVVTLRAELVEPVKDGRARIRFSVMDNGIGMKPETVKNLFTPFTQADQSTTRRFGGTGLGLSISKNLSDLMDGVIDVESTEGEGSAFHVTLPFDIAEQSADHIRTFDLSGLNIAYAVEHDDTAEAVERYAAGGGARVARFPANDIVANVKALAKSDPLDLIVLGMLDDGQDRDAIIETLRADDDVPGLRFVVLTDDRSERRGMILPDKVVVESAPVRKSGFMHGVAMAAGRASPLVENDVPKLSADARKAPEVEEAREAGELILVAEDNITNQDVIRRQLNVLGYACEVADDGVIALAMLKDGRYGLLLTDCHMPNMDGYELTGALRDQELDSGKRLPVVAITANALQGEAERCLASGMDDYMAKPLEMTKLKAMLAKWLPVDHGAAGAASAPQSAPTESAPASDAPDDVVVNIKALTDVFGDDMDTVKEILGEYVQPSRDIIGEIVTGYEAHDADAVGKAGHKLKSSSRAIGANALADLCFELETAGKGGDWDAIEKLYPELHPTFDAVVTFIEQL